MSSTSKSKKTNGFMLFIKDLTKDDSEFAKFSMIELVEAAKDLWSKLSDDEKENYKEKAKIENVRKGKRPFPETIKKESDVVEEKKVKVNDIEEDDNNRLFDVKDMVQLASELGELDDRIFYLLSITNFYEDGSDIFPAEIAIAKFSLREGIFDDMQIRINPGKLPVGSTRLANERSSLIHKYPLPKRYDTEDDDDDDDDYGERNYVIILDKIIEFLHPLDDIPIFFTEGSINNSPEILKNTRRAFTKIFEQAGEYQIATSLKIFSIIELFYHLNVAVTEQKQLNDPNVVAFPSFAYAETMFDRLESTHYTIKGCKYHEENDILYHCCLSKVRRFAYTISKYCSNEVKYALKEGRHYPKGMIVTHLLQN